MAGNRNKGMETAGIAATNFQEAVRGLELGAEPPIRKMVYDMVQAQTRTGRVGAFYNNLQCGIHNGLLNEPVALICGHTFCRGCMTTRNRCPACGSSSEPLPAVNEIISELIKRITPPGAFPSAPLVGAGKTRRRQTRKYRNRRR